MKLSIFSRLVIGYSALLTLSVAVSLYSIVQFGTVEEVTQSIMMKDYALLDLHAKLTDSLLSETRYEKKFVIFKDDSLQISFFQARDEFDQSLKTALGLSDSPEMKNLLKGIESLHAQYQEVVNEEFGLILQVQKYPADRFEYRKEAITNTLIEELRKFKPMNQKIVFDKIKNLGDNGLKSRKIAVMIFAVSFLTGVLLAIAITRSITVPLLRMKKKTRDIAQGVFDSDLNVPSPPEIEELAKDFNLMCSRLKQVDRMKSDFFAVMSHELRTPLTSIREGTNLLSESLGNEPEERQKKILKIINEECNRLIGLINSLLDLSKMEAGMLAYNFVPAHISPLIEKVIEAVTPLADARHIRIRQNVGELPAIKMDTERILQALRNLMGNALKFSPDRGQVTVTAEHAPEGLMVSVNDTGPGIPGDQLAIIFDKFRQVTTGGKHPAKGTGLGLAIVRHIIHSHGGKVWAESTPGHGSTFRFILPV